MSDARADENYIPIVDFGSYGLGLDAQACDVSSLQTLAKQIHDAFSTVGFVYLKNHGISESMIEGVYGKADAFFSLPVDTKSKYVRPGDSNHGWVSLECEGLNPERPARDLKEAFNITPSTAHVWPDADVPGFERGARAFFAVCLELTHRVLDLMAIGLGLQDRDFFRKCHDSTCPNATTIRMLHYPPLQRSQLKTGQVRCGEHSDYGSITLLFQDDIGGLEVKHKNGHYVAATPIPGTIVVNIGDLMQRWTADKLVSTKHRVMIPDSERQLASHRKSIAFFVHPNDDCLITCLDGSDKYKPITSLDYLKYRFGLTY